MKLNRRHFLGTLSGTFLCKQLFGSNLLNAAELSDTNEDTDVLIIGGGASGAAAAWSLSNDGFKVVCLEQGDWVDYSQSPAVTKDWELTRQRSWNPNPNIRDLPVDYPVNDVESAIKPLMYNAVGGSTILWSCHSPRFHPSDFATRTLDGVGEDWPISYEDLEPFYELNDKICGIAGLNGDPAYPQHNSHRLPPAPLGKGAEKIAGACDRLDWHWWPSDIQINTVAYGKGRGPCNNCGPCELACPLGAKGSTDFTYWPDAVKNGTKIITGARVFEVETDSKGKAKGALYVDAKGKIRRYGAKFVIIAANGIGTPRLLLLSASKKYPNGLANSSGQVGKNLMLHPVALSTGVFDEPLDGYKGITAASIMSHEFYETDTSRGFSRGYMLQVLRSLGPLLTSLGAYGVPVSWGDSHHRRFLEVFNRTASVAVVAEDIADPSNRVTLDENLKDSSGIPAPKISYVLGDNSRKMLAHGIEKAEYLLKEAGAIEVHNIDLIEQAGFHLMGTARMGSNPDTSVVNEWGETHDVKNLFIIDGSIFTTAAAVNPTITIQALALRTAKYLKENRDNV